MCGVCACGGGSVTIRPLSRSAAGIVDGVAGPDAAEVTVGDGDSAVAEQVADGGDRCAFFDEVDGKSVAEGVGVDPLRDAGASGKAGKQVADVAGVDRAAVQVQNSGAASWFGILFRRTRSQRSRMATVPASRPTTRLLPPLPCRSVRVLRSRSMSRSSTARISPTRRPQRQATTIREALRMPMGARREHAAM